MWLISISNPILDASGQFVGVATCDVMLDTINQIQFDMGGYGTAYSYVLTDQGTYLSHSADQTLAGTRYSGADALQSVAQGKEYFREEKDAGSGQMVYRIHLPIFINGIEQPLSGAFVVQTQEALAGVRQITGIILAVAFFGTILLGVCVVLLLKKALSPMKDVVALADEMRRGNLSADFEIRSNDEFGELARSFRQTCAALHAYVDEISSVLGQLGNGDLTVTIAHEYTGDFAPIKTALLNIAESLQQVFSGIDGSAGQVHAGAQQISEESRVLAQGVRQQAQAVEALSLSVETVSGQAEKNAGHVRRAAGYVEETDHQVAQGTNQMTELTAAMRNIIDSSLQIAKITKMMESIAFQTNILALNASVEAAHAGQAGRGFAVVANEVRALAAKSADAAKDAADLIQKCTDQVQKGSKIVSQTNEILCGIEERSARLHGIMNQIDTSAAEQALAISQITQGLSQVSSVVQSNAQSAERESETSRTLLEQAGCLYQEMGRFRFSVPCEETKQGPKKLSAVQNAQKRPGQIAREPEIQESAVEQDIQEETQESAVEQDIQEETQESAVERDIQEETQESAVEQDVQEETQESTIEQDIQEEAQEKTGHGEDTAADLPE